MIIDLRFIKIRCYNNYKNYVGYAIWVILVKDYHYLRIM
jgi:hypothetical protein